MITQWIFYFGTVPYDEPISFPNKKPPLELPVSKSKALYNIPTGHYVIPSGYYSYQCRELFENKAATFKYEAMGFRPFPGRSAECTASLIAQVEEMLKLPKRSAFSKKIFGIGDEEFSILWIELAPFWHPTSIRTRCRLSFLTMLLRSTKSFTSLEDIVKHSESRAAMELFLSGHTHFIGRNWHDKHIWQFHFNCKTKNVVRNKLVRKP